MTTDVTPVEVNLNGRWPLVLPAHRAERPEWTSPAGWERARLDSMFLHVTEGDVVFDIGAEEGDMTALYASWGARVVAVEPNAAVWPNIRWCFEFNDLRPLGWWVGFAAAEAMVPAVAGGDNDDVNGWPACAFGPVIGDHGFQNLSERPDRARTTLDALAERFGRPQHVTIDVEGSEVEVLRGGDGVLSGSAIGALPPGDRPNVWVAVHPKFMRDMHGHTAAYLHHLLRDYGYHGPHILDSHHEQHEAWFPE